MCTGVYVAPEDPHANRSGPAHAGPVNVLLPWPALGLHQVKGWSECEAGTCCIGGLCAGVGHLPGWGQRPVPWEAMWTETMKCSVCRACARGACRWGCAESSSTTYQHQQMGGHALSSGPSQVSWGCWAWHRVVLEAGGWVRIVRVWFQG